MECHKEFKSAEEHASKWKESVRERECEREKMSDIDANIIFNIQLTLQPN